MSGVNKLFERLAAHDAKVRADALAEIVKVYDDPDMTEQIFSVYLHNRLAAVASPAEEQLKSA
jgi:hypothetical protein